MTKHVNSEINKEMHFSDNMFHQPMQLNQAPEINVEVNVNTIFHENQLLRELNNNLLIEISQLKLEIDMMELKALCKDERLVYLYKTSIF